MGISLEPLIWATTEALALKEVAGKATEEGLRDREGLDSSLIVVESELERSREEAQAMNC